MKLRALCLLAILTCTVPGAAQGENLSLARTFPKDRLQELLMSPTQWHPFPKAGERAAWERLPEDVLQKLLTDGETCAETEIPALPASLYLEYQREGNRSRYQDAWFARRRLLNELALAECVEGKGRFLDPLANVAWAICEESSWVFPAHIRRQKAGTGLPDTTEPVVALFSAETASSLAWVVYLLEEQLNQVSPQVCKRIRKASGIEVDIIDGALEAQLILENQSADQYLGYTAYLYVDVGGGSTEITLSSKGQVAVSGSFKIGTIRLLQGQVAKSDWDAMKTWLQDFAYKINIYWWVFGLAGL